MSDLALSVFASVVDSEEIRLLQRDLSLPDAYLDDLREHIAPLALAVAQQLTANSGPRLLGINGCQGSGKSTIARFLCNMLRIGAGLRCVTVSIDDFYLTKSARLELAADIHPLLGTRGVPGTHDLPLAVNTLKALLDPSGRADVCVPEFNKATDDRRPKETWPRVAPGADVVILEGWCVGCTPEKSDALVAPLNALEHSEDADGIWRHYVNDALGNDYASLFQQLDWLIMLAAPSFDCVYEWRQQQEEQLAESIAQNGGVPDSLLSGDSLQRFIDHFERLTRHQLHTLPPRCDAVISLADTHRMVSHSGPLFT